MDKISVVINTHNEENNLPRAIASVKDLVNEIVVVDMHSTDKTVEIAKDLGAKVYDFETVGYVEPARNYSISKATGEWILILDADEEIRIELKKMIKELIQKSEADFFRIPRKNIVFGKWLKHSRWWPDYNIRLFKKGSVTWDEVIHSVPFAKGVGADLPENVENAIVHHHYDSVEQYLLRMNGYTTLHARNHIKDGYKFSWPDLISKPSNEFFSRFFLGAGYKDGIHGLAMSGLQAFSEFVMYLKIWLYTSKKEANNNFSLNDVVTVIKKSLKDLYYWQADALFNNEGGIVNRIKRRFRLP